jgi:hypothetical protein
MSEGYGYSAVSISVPEWRQSFGIFTRYSIFIFIRHYTYFIGSTVLLSKNEVENLA